LPRLLFICILGLWLSVSGEPSLLTREPPIISDSALTALKQDLEFSTDYPCNLPGSIPDSDKDGTCFHPLQSLIDAYDDADVFEEKDYQKKEKDLKIALYTYRAFSSVKKEAPKQYRFSHKQYLSFVHSPEKEPEEMSWLMKQLQRLSMLFLKHIWEPFKEWIIAPLRGLALGWKIFLIAFAALALIFLIVTISRGIGRYFPESDYAETAADKPGRGRVTIRSDQFVLANRLADQGQYLKALEVFYFWFIEGFSGRGGIKRYEWWTNRQLLSLVEKRSPQNYRLSCSIVNQYESAVYGHRHIDPPALKQLISEAGTSSLNKRH
jgi:hypothetical protein